MRMKFYFVICILFVAVMEQIAALRKQESRSLACISDSVQYYCYSLKNNKVISIDKNKLDELLDSSETQHYDKSESYDFSSEEERKMYVPPFNKLDKRSFSSNYEKHHFSTILPDIWSYLNKRWYPHGLSRKRPFDSISYRGQFGGFGKR